MPTFTGKFDERPAWDNVVYDDAGTGPSTGDSTMAAYADLLQQQPDTVAYVVGYSTAGSAPGAWRRGAKELADRLESDYKIAADRIKILCGGYDLKTEDESGGFSAQVHLWILPKNSPPPVAEVTGPEPVPEGAVRIGEFDDLSLNEDAYARRVFRGFVDVLDKDKQMQACIIIRLANRTQEDVEQDKRLGFTRADLPALAQRWRDDLEKNGISRDRLFVLAGEAGEYRGSTVETWLVPKGAQLPDPNAFEEEQPLTEEEMSQEETTPEEDKPQ